MMFGTEIIQALFDADVLYEQANGTVERSGWFIEDVADEQIRLSEMSAAEREEFIEMRLEADLAELFDGDETHILPELLTLHDSTESLSGPPVLWGAIVLNQYRPTLPPQDGSPELFLPVHADRLPIILGLASTSIVYVWRHDCPPCEVVCADLEEMINPVAIDRPLFAIYGPDSAEFLHEEYDVYGGPTVLFCVGDRVDMRVQGPQARKLLYRALSMKAEPLVRDRQDIEGLADQR